jgi:hypothetical protein
MKFGEQNILRNGNVGKPGRSNGQSNKRTRLMKIIGEENYEQLCKKQVDVALYCEDLDQAASAQRFIMNLVEPKPAPIPHETYVGDIALSPMRTIENIKNNEDLILKKICDGDISLDVGERFCALIEQARKTYEVTEIARILTEMDQRMKENGI